MAPKKKAGAGAGRGARGAGPSTVKPSSAADPGIDIVFDKPKPKSRGHRQRGAGTVMVDRGGIERDGITVLSWQRLPTQLVQQHADRMQAKRPQYHPVRASAGDLFRYRIVIPDRKNSSKDMAFCPTESFHTAAQAKEHAALLALLKLQEDQPLERKLPEPYKTTWLQSVAAMKGEDKRPLARWEKAKKVREEKEREEKEKAQAAVKAKASEAEASLGDSLWGASVEKEEEQKRKNEAIRRVTEGPAAVVLKADTKYVSKFEADKARAEKEKIIKDRRRKAEARARSNMDMKVMMSARIRRLLEEALGLAEERERHRDAGGEGPDDQGLTAESLEGADLAVFENVLAMGFPAYDVLRGLAACPRGDANESARERTDILLEWLCLHLEEEDLPKGFDPRGRNLDVIRAGQNFAAPAAAATAVANTNSTGVYSQRIGDRGVVEGGEGSVSVEGRLLRYGFGRNEVTRAIAEAAAAKEAKGVGEEEERGDSLDVRTLGPLEILARGLISSGLYSAVSGDKRRGGDKGGGDAEDGFPTEEEGREVVEEEVMSLEAIYDEAVTVAPSMPLGAYLLTFDLAKLASMPTEAWLDVWILQAGGIGGYPIEASPVCLVRGPKLSPQRLEAKRALLLPAQRALAGRASSLRGNPAIYDVLVWAIDELPSMLTFDAKGTPAVSAAVAGAGRTREAKPAKSAVAPVTVGEGGQGAGSTRAGGGDSGSGGRGRMVQPHLPGIEPLWDSGATRYEEGGSRGGDGSGVAGRWRRGGGSGSGVHRGRGGGGLERRRNQGRGKASTEEEKQHEGEREVVERPRPPQPVERSREFERKRRQREALPAAKARSEFLSMVRRSPVVLVSGETGCGKTTQIPQFLLEEWEESAACDGKDSDMRVLVTQPRRIAAVGVAQRVADERCEEVGAVGGVGYKIRGESRAGPGTRLLFCTTGLLLRRMQGDHLLKEVSHLVVDEVHERHLDADFLLALLLGILPKRPKLKVILMSATLDTARFAAYFARVPGLPGGKTPILHIPGRTFPVRELYLEDALAATGYRPRLRRGGKKNKTSEGQEDLASGGRGAEQGVEEEESQEEDDEDNENDGVQGEELSRLGGGGGGGFDMDQVDEDHLDYGLIASLVLFVVSPHGERYLGFRDDAREDGSGGNGSGSVLVFMPGTMEIDRLCRELEHSTEGGAQHLWVLPLHGSLPPQKQRAVFDPAPRGLRKVVVSTNIAETSITIPDVTVVVDSCRVKEMGYDVARQMPRLQESWASKDSLTQRKGRAGRVREGVSFRLIRRVTYRRLPEHGTPEIRRVPLDHLVLQIKALGVEEHPAVVLARALDPPDEEAVQDAVDGLTELKALGDGAELTPLGWHLAALPCPVQVGKMIIYGAVLGCLSPLLSIAAGLSCRSPFLSTGDPAKREEIDAAKKRMAAVGGGRSDHTLLAVAVTEWEASAAESGPGGRDRARKRFCSENGISFERMRELTEVRQQLAQALAGIGFIPSPRAAFDLRASVNAQAGSWRAVKAAACAGLYPRVVRVVRPMEKFVDLVGVGAVSVRHTAKEFHFFTRSRRREGGATGTATKDERVFIHPTSINFTTNDWSCPWLVYHERVHTSRVFVRDCTEVSPYAILLFGGKISVQAGLGRIAVDDGWVRFEAVGRIAALVNGLRQRLDGMLWEKIEDPRLDIAGSKLSRALVELLQTDGMG